MQIKLFFSLSVSVFSALHATVQATVPSEHSVAPEIWTDILGAFIQKHSKRSLRYGTGHRHQWSKSAKSRVLGVPITTSTSLVHNLSEPLLISQRYQPCCSCIAWGTWGQKLL